MDDCLMRTFGRTNKQTNDGVTANKRLPDERRNEDYVTNERMTGNSRLTNERLPSKPRMIREGYVVWLYRPESAIIHPAMQCALGVEPYRHTRAPATLS